MKSDWRYHGYTCAFSFEGVCIPEKDFRSMSEKDVATFYFNKVRGLADSGDRSDVANTGALRDMAPGKGRFDLLPFYGLQQLAAHFADGAVKDEDRNWEKGLPLYIYIDSALRHATKLAGGLTDERHDRAAAWNMICYLETREKVISGLLAFSLTDKLHPSLIEEIKMEMAERGSIIGVEEKNA